MGGIAEKWGSDCPNLFFPWGGVSNTVLLGTTRVSLPNGISFNSTALAACTSVTDDTHTDIDYIQTDRPHAVTKCQMYNLYSAFT